MSLYEISDKYIALLRESIDEDTGEIIDAKLEALDQCSGDLQEKGIAVASFIKNLEADEVAIDAAICSMELRRDRLKKRRRAMLDYLKDNMDRTGITEISCPYFVAKTKKCPPSVEILNEKYIPDRFFTKKEVFSLNKLELKKCLQQGENIEGVSLKQNTRLEIR
jgi:hypothetical protein